MGGCRRAQGAPPLAELVLIVQRWDVHPDHKDLAGNWMRANAEG